VNPDGSARVAVAKCAGYQKDTLKNELLGVLALLNVKPDAFHRKKVLIKPNLLSPSRPEKAVTTHPLFVRAATEIVLDAGAEVTLGDSPALGNLEKCLKEGGYLEALKGLPIRFGAFTMPVTVKNRPKGVKSEYVIAREAADCDLIVNLPKLKTHTLMGLTGAVKNMFGLMLGLSKARMHLETGRDTLLFARRLVDLCYLKKPFLTLVDAVIAMDGNGPAGGDPFPMGLIIAGRDPVAIDAVAADITRYPRDRMPLFEAAALAGRGVRDADHIAVVGEPPDAIKVDGFRPAMRLSPMMIVPEWIVRPIKEFISCRPVISRKQCNLCGECITICPGQVISIQKEKIRVDTEKCIRCFCCQEICPEGAIRAERKFLGKIVAKMLFRD
jgi:uncharacterized protein (DUF362 family)/NAD-dependent dihydropyrimidine dehydrogenase PreA subunit